MEGCEQGHELRDARAVGAEQTNTSVVFDEELILKVFRRLEAGIDPELELLRFLTERELREHRRACGLVLCTSGRPMDATLGILQRYVVGGLDGWDLALDTMHDEAESSSCERLYRLGEVTGRMHTLLGSESSGSSFAPEEPSSESLGLLTGRRSTTRSRAFSRNFQMQVEVLAPIRGRGEEVRERLRQLTQVGAIGRVIRHHGDFHLGQTLWAGDDWVVIDFEGEPARSLPERRRKRSPLRDVAGMMRSFAYAATATQLVRGVDPPLGWEVRARPEFLTGYRATIEPSLIPSGRQSTSCSPCSSSRRRCTSFATS